MDILSRTPAQKLILASSSFSGRESCLQRLKIMRVCFISVCSPSRLACSSRASARPTSAGCDGDATKLLHSKYELSTCFTRYAVFSKISAEFQEERVAWRIRDKKGRHDAVLIEKHIDSGAVDGERRETKLSDPARVLDGFEDDSSSDSESDGGDRTQKPVSHTEKLDSINEEEEEEDTGNVESKTKDKMRNCKEVDSDSESDEDEDEEEVQSRGKSRKLEAYQESSSESEDDQEDETSKDEHRTDEEESDSSSEDEKKMDKVKLKTKKSVKAEKINERANEYDEQEGDAIGELAIDKQHFDDGEESTDSAIENEIGEETEDVDDDDDDDDECWEEEDEEAEAEVGDGGDGGGFVLGGAGWGKKALELAEEVVSAFGDDYSLYAFKVSADAGLIRVRLDKQSASPGMNDMEKFSLSYTKLLEEHGQTGVVPSNLAVEVSSPGAERVLRIPQDLVRFKHRPMYVRYVEEVPGSVDGKGVVKDGILQLETLDIDAGLSTWKIADVRLNRESAGKGRPLNSKQRKWRTQFPLHSLRLVRLYMDV